MRQEKAGGRVSAFILVEQHFPETVLSSPLVGDMTETVFASIN